MPRKKPNSLHFSVNGKKLDISARSKSPLPSLLEAQDHRAVSRASHPCSAVVLKSSRSDRDTGCAGRALKLHDVQAWHRRGTSRGDDHTGAERRVIGEVVDADHLATCVEGRSLAGGCEDDIGLAVGVRDIGKFISLNGGCKVQAGDVRRQTEGVGGGGAPDGDAGGRGRGREDGCLEEGLHDHFEGVEVLKVGK